MFQESGRSMIEMLGVLAIMGVITVGAIEMIQLAMNTQKRNTVNEEVLQIVTQVRSVFGEYDDFSNINKSNKGHTTRRLCAPGNRYWSTPIPVWECSHCGERKVLGSIQEIEKESGVKVDNLHKQYLDKITLQ